MVANAAVHAAAPRFSYFHICGIRVRDVGIVRCEVVPEPATDALLVFINATHNLPVYTSTLS